jgi:hypothetical protein
MIQFDSFHVLKARQFGGNTFLTRILRGYHRAKRRSLPCLLLTGSSIGGEGGWH